MSRLTIVLTLKDRAEFTRRWMRFMNDQRCPYKILIADGGADDVIEAWLRDATNCPNLDYDYLRYPYDHDLQGFYAKQLDVCRRVDTEYLLLADNDDFYLIDRIPLFIDFLDHNPHYSGCRGAIAQLSLISKDGGVVNGPIGEIYRAAHHESRSIEHDGFIERIECFFNELVQYDHWRNWYCIHRQDQLVGSLEAVHKYHYADVVLNEILLLLLLLREGKVKVAEPLFYIRQMGSSQGESGFLAENNVLERLLIHDACHCFNEFIRAEGLVSGEPDRIRILKAFANYIGIWCNSCSTQYRAPSLVDRFGCAYRLFLNRNRLAIQSIDSVVFRWSHLLRGTRNRQVIRVPAIENYILSGR